MRKSYTFQKASFKSFGFRSEVQSAIDKAISYVVQLPAAVVNLGLNYGFKFLMMPILLPFNIWNKIKENAEENRPRDDNYEPKVAQMEQSLFVDDGLSIIENQEKKGFIPSNCWLIHDSFKHNLTTYYVQKDTLSKSKVNKINHAIRQTLYLCAALVYGVTNLAAHALVSAISIPLIFGSMVKELISGKREERDDLSSADERTSSFSSSGRARMDSFLHVFEEDVVAADNQKFDISQL